MATLVLRTKGMPAEVITLRKGRNQLGRSSCADFQIFNDTLSRLHCEIEVKDDALVVRDLDSSNGTFVNEQPVEQPALLQTGDRLRMGDVTFEVTEAPAPVEEGAVPACANHPALPASMICTQCSRVFCGACVHVLRRSGGKFLRLCPACSGHCESLKTFELDRKGFVGTFIKKLFRKAPNQNGPKPFHE